MRSLNRVALAISLLFIFAFSTARAQEMTQESRPNASQQSQQLDPEIVVPAGTSIPVVLSAYLNSRSTQVGDYFYMDTVYPVWIHQMLAIPKGSTIRGTVTEVVRPGRIKGRGRIAIRFENILLPNGVSRDLIANFRGIHGGGDEKIDRKTETVEMGGSKGQDAGEIIGTSSQGAIIGAISGGGRGAGIGAGAGAAVGLVTVLFTRGRELILEPGTQFDIELKQPLRYAYGELQFTNDQLNSARRNPATNRTRYNKDQRQPPYYPARRGLPVPWYYPWR